MAVRIPPHPFIPVLHTALLPHPLRTFTLLDYYCPHAQAHCTPHPPPARAPPPFPPPSAALRCGVLRYGQFGVTVLPLPTLPTLLHRAPHARRPPLVWTPSHRDCFVFGRTAFGRRVTYILPHLQFGCTWFATYGSVPPYLGPHVLLYTPFSWFPTLVPHHYHTTVYLRTIGVHPFVGWLDCLPLDAARNIFSHGYRVLQPPALHMAHLIHPFCCGRTFTAHTHTTRFGPPPTPLGCPYTTTHANSLSTVTSYPPLPHGCGTRLPWFCLYAGTDIAVDAFHPSYHTCSAVERRHSLRLVSWLNISGRTR